MENREPDADDTREAGAPKTWLGIGRPIDRQQLEEERKTLDDLNRKPFLERIRGFWKFTGPGFIQSAVTLGAGTAGGCLIAGSKFGYQLLWVQPLAMVLGFFMFFAIARQTLFVGRRPYEAFHHELHYAFAFLFGLSALVVTVIWHFPQYSLAADVANDLAGLVTGTERPIPTWVLGTVLLLFSVFVTWSYGKGLKGIKIYEKTLKFLVWVIVAAFALVVLKTPVNWKEFFGGLVPKFPRLPNGSFDRELANVMIALLGASIGLNMVFLYPYSLMAKGWGKEHNRLAYFDLVTGLLIPFVLATGFMVMATSNMLHKRGAIERGNKKGDKSVTVNIEAIAEESNATVTFDATVSEELPQYVEEVSCVAMVRCKEKVKGKPSLILEKEATVATRLGAAMPQHKNVEGKPPGLAAEASAALLTDHEGDGVPGAGDTLRYEVTIRNNGKTPLTDVIFTAAPDRNTELVKGSVQSRSITKSAVEAARVLSPLVGVAFGRLVFGVGMLAIALSTITVHMLMCAFIISEMFHVEPAGWRYRAMVLTPAIGAFGSAWRLPFGLGVFASSLCVIFLPMAYICFMILHNKRRYMGEAMPRGGKRIFWNAGMFLAIAVVTLSAVVQLTIFYGDVKKHLLKPRPKAAVVEAVRVGAAEKATFRPRPLRTVSRFSR